MKKRKQSEYTVVSNSDADVKRPRLCRYKYNQRIRHESRHNQIQVAKKDMTMMNLKMNNILFFFLCRQRFAVNVFSSRYQRNKQKMRIEKHTNFKSFMIDTLEWREAAEKEGAPICSDARVRRHAQRIMCRPKKGQPGRITSAWKSRNSLWIQRHLFFFCVCLYNSILYPACVLFGSCV